MPKPLFGSFVFQQGSEAAAREVFQTLITDLVAVRYPTANEVAGPGGSDWGIDTYVGQLDESIVVWQSKFFLEWKGDVQRGQVRSSLNEIVKKAKEKDFRIEAWTLCVPCILPPEEQRWFDTWAARMRRLHKIVMINIWNGVELRRQLMQEDASAVRNAYFPPVGSSQPSEPVATSNNLHGMATSLFVRQLEEAGYIENDAARGLFFAAEALARDLAVKENREGTAALEELHLEIQEIWESQFNSALSSASASGRMEGLVNRVLREAGNCADPQHLSLRPAHRKGVAHRLVRSFVT